MDIYYSERYEGSKTTYDTSEKLAFAIVDRSGLAADNGGPEFFTVGKVCTILHRSKPKDCVHRVGKNDGL